MIKIDELISDIQKGNNGKSVDFLIPEELESKITGYWSMQIDLEICHSALENIKKADSQLIKISLFTTIIILYGKCFTSCKSKSPKLELSIFDEFEEFKEYHNKLMDLRHNFIAHRGYSENDIGKSYFSIDVETMTWGIGVHNAKNIGFESDEELEKYILILKYLVVKVNEMQTKQAEKLGMHIFENGLISSMKMLNNDHKVLQSILDYRKKKNS